MMESPTVLPILLKFIIIECVLIIWKGFLLLFFFKMNYKSEIRNLNIEVTQTE